MWFKKGANSEYGARPLKRFNRYTYSQIAEKILLGELKNEGEIVIDVEEGKLTFTSM